MANAREGPAEVATTAEEAGPTEEAKTAKEAKPAVVSMLAL